MLTNEGAGMVVAASAGWGRDAPMPFPADVGGGTIMTESMPTVDSPRTLSAASGAAGCAEPPAPSSGCSADATDAMVSKIDGSANICSITTSSTLRSLLGCSGASRSTVPMPGKSTYRHDDKSVAPSTDAAPAAVET
jgi:hypothetical protein